MNTANHLHILDLVFPNLNILTHWNWMKLAYKLIKSGLSMLQGERDGLCAYRSTGDAVVFTRPFLCLKGKALSCCSKTRDVMEVRGLYCNGSIHLSGHPL